MSVATSITSGYPAFARFAHWLVFVLVVSAFTTGFVGYWGAVTQPWQTAPIQGVSPTGALLSGTSRPAGAPGPLDAQQLAVRAQQIRGESPWSSNQLHKSLGVIVLAMTALRLMYRAASRYPVVPPDMPRAMVYAAKCSHALLYLGLVAQPLLGITGSGKAFMFLGTFTIPSFKTFHPYIRQLHTAHVYVAYLLLFLIFVHASAALFHHYVRKDNVLRAMLVGR